MRGENIKKVSDLFAKYKQRLVAPEASVINVFVEVVHDLLELDINPKKVSYSPHTRVIAINGGGPLKTEIKLHEKEILTHIKGRLGEKSAPKTII
jgi:hypothetical protein